MKKFTTTKNFLNDPINSFFCIRSCKNNFLMVFLTKIDFSKKSIFWLWENFEKSFSRFFFCKRLKKKHFFNFEKYGLSAFQRRFKCQKILKIDQSKLIWNFKIFVIFQIFFSKFQNFAKNSNFQAFLEQKLKVIWKTIPEQKMRRIIKKINFCH